MNIVATSKRGFYSQTEPEGCLNITVVLTMGVVGDYAAYEGHGSPEWVAANGQKLLEADARKLFRIPDEAVYRY